MPYKILKKGSGYKVCKKNSNKCFSKHPIPKKRAENQLKSLYASESNLKNEKINFADLVILTLIDNK